MPQHEIELIRGIRRRASQGPRNSVVRLGIGDDCAVLRPGKGEEMLVTTDFSIEGVHFRREWHPPESVGHRCLARGLSDIASMGGKPQAAFLSLGLPSELPQSWVDAFFRGFLAVAGKYHVTLAGGDTAQSPAGIIADVVVLGSVPQGEAVLRGVARPGDSIYVTGALGSAAATLKQLFESGKAPLRGKAHRAHFYPEPRVAVGQWLRKRRAASAMIDLSDGLSTDLSHICEESNVGAVIEEKALPIQLRVRKRKDALELALHGGEDYELLFTASKRLTVDRIEGVSVTRIGEIVPLRRGRSTMQLVGEKHSTELQPQGWEHFARSGGK